MNAVSEISSMITTILILVACIVLPVIANWKIFVKAGEPGWKSLIPIYYSYIHYKIAWKPFYFIVHMVIVAAAIPFAVIAVYSGSSLCLILTLLLYVCRFILQILFSMKLSAAFDHGILFTLGLIFLGPIFMIILGFDSSEYQGPQ